MQIIKKDSISFKEVILILSRQLKAILIIPTIFCTLAIIYVLFFTKPYYISTSKFMSSSTRGTISQAAGLAAQFGIALPASQSEPTWLHSDIIKSRTLARAMLKRKFDTEEFGQQKPLLQILTYGNNKPKDSMNTLEVLAIESVIKKINITEDRKSGIFTLTLSASEPQLASDIIAALIEEVDIHLKEFNKATTSKTRQFIEERIVGTEKELMKAEETHKNFMDRNRRMENSPALKLQQQRLSREVSVLTGVFTTLKQQLETTKIEEVRESDYVFILDPPEVPIKRSGPDRRKIVTLYGLLGIGLGIAFGFLKEYVESIDAEGREFMNQIKSEVYKNITELIPRKKTSE